MPYQGWVTTFEEEGDNPWVEDTERAQDPTRIFPEEMAVMRQCPHVAVSNGVDDDDGDC